MSDFRMSTILILLLTITFVGCDSRKDASVSNFTNVLNDYYENNCLLISPGDVNFPVTIIEGEVNFGRKNPEKYKALEDAGILESKEITVYENKDFLSKEKVEVPAKVYSMTDYGKDLFMESSLGGTFSGLNKGFRIAKYKVEEIKNFSEPSQAMAYNISKVNYSYSPVDIQEWAKNRNIEKAFPWLSRQLQNEQKTTAILILMNDGWVHQKEAQL